jgi:hypothetical protein
MMTDYGDDDENDEDYRTATAEVTKEQTKMTTMRMRRVRDELEDSSQSVWTD